MKHKSTEDRQYNSQEREKEQTDNDLQSYRQKINIEQNEASKNTGWIHVFWTVKLSLPTSGIRHITVVNISSGKSWIRKWWKCDSDKGNISVFMCDKYITEVLIKSWWRTNNIRSDDFQLATRNRWIRRMRVSSNLLS